MESQARPSGSSRPPIERVLRHVLERTGVVSSVDTLELLRRTRPAQEDHGAPLDWLDAAARQAGMRTSLLGLTLDDALAGYRDGQPLVTCVTCPAGAQRWVSVEDAGKGTVQVREFQGEGQGEAKRLSVSQLRVLLGQAPDEPLAWFTAESATPCAPAATDPKAIRPLSPFRRLLRLLRPDKRELWTVLIFAVATGVLMLAAPIAVQALVNFVAFGGAIPPLVVVALLLLTGLGFAAALTATQAWIVEILQRRIFVRMVADLSARLPRVTLAARGHGYGPELVNRFFDIVTIQKVGSALLLDGLSVLLSVLVGLAILAFYHPLLLAFDILLLVVIAALVFGPVRRGIYSAIQESKAKYSVAAWLEEMARNPLAFKTAGAQHWVFNESDRLALRYVEARKSHYRVVFGQVVAGLTLQVLANTALLAIGGLLVIRGSLTLGQLVAAELIVTMVVSSVAKMGKHLEGFYDLMAAVDKVGQLLDLPLEAASGELPGFPEGPSELVLDGVRWQGCSPEVESAGLSLTLPAGARLGLAGESGAGKSRLLQMIWGLLPIERGSLRIDGRDVRALAPEYLRRVVSMTTQVEIIAGSIRENVRLGRPFVSDDDVREALDKVGLLGSLAALPQGLDTQVAPDSYPLAEGQAELLVIARAIASRPRLLLLDVPTHHVSATQQEHLRDMLFDPQAPWTLVLVSNQAEVLERCDSILHMPDGRVSEPETAALSAP